MNVWKAIFGKEENEGDKPILGQHIQQPRERYYTLPPCRTLEDLARLTLNDPTPEQLVGFRACLEALYFEPAAFLDVAFHVEGGWSAYHALHEVRQLCGPQVRKFASIVLHALAVQNQEELA